jgi:hypothetical protein
MKKYVTLFLIALMAVSVVSAAGVVTAKKADAAPTKTIVVPYATGTTYTITPKQFNEHDTYITSLYKTNKPPSIQLSSKWSAASASITISKLVASAYIDADAGAYVGVAGAAANDQITVTTKVNYTMSVSGGDEPYYNHAWVVVSVGLPTWDVYEIYSPDAQSGTLTYVWTGSVSDFFYNYDVTTGVYSGSIDVDVGCQVVAETIPGQASATAEFSSIVIQF